MDTEIRTPECEALLDAVAHFREQHTQEPHVAIGAIEQFADELHTLRVASRNKRYRGSCTQCFYIAKRLELAVPLDERLNTSRVRMLAAVLDNLGFSLSDNDRAVSREERQLMRLLEREARRIVKQMVRRADAASSQASEARKIEAHVN
jgi:hypothetical protein